MVKNYVLPIIIYNRIRNLHKMTEQVYSLRNLDIICDIYSVLEECSKKVTKSILLVIYTFEICSIYCIELLCIHRMIIFYRFY